MADSDETPESAKPGDGQPKRLPDGATVYSLEVDWEFVIAIRGELIEIEHPEEDADRDDLRRNSN